MKTTILAETQPKQSCNEDGLMFFRQYAIAFDLSQDERNQLYESVRMENIFSLDNPVITLSRRVDVRGQNVTPWEWTYYDAFKDQQAASFGFGDSDYWRNAISVNILHTEALEHAAWEQTLRNEKKALEEERNGLKAKYQAEYDAQLKARKIYSKAMNGTAPQAVVDEIRYSIRAAYQAELTRINAQLGE